MERGPAPGHSVRKICSGCDSYTEVDGNEPVQKTVKGWISSVLGLPSVIGHAMEARAKKREFEKSTLQGEPVVLRDEHSEYDGESGTVTDVWEDMFGELRYTVSFDSGEEHGISGDLLEIQETSP